MFWTRSIGSLLCSGLTIALCLLASGASAQERIIVENGKGIYLPHIGSVETVFVADTAIADITSSPGEAVFLFGKSVGETSLIATDLEGKETFNYTISVIHNLQELARSMNLRFKGENIILQATQGSVMVSGTVSNERVRQNILTTLQGGLAGTSVIDRMVAKASNLIQLDVALYEVNRSRVENFGINWRALVANGRAQSISGVTNALNLLVQNGVAAVLTETTMTTVSGRPANFTVGGEVPVPAFSGNGDTNDSRFGLEFKFIGMDLEFAPEQLNDDVLRLDINSTITSPLGGSATINGNSFPTLSSRGFQTTVELKENQSFVIAGLSKSETFSSLYDSKNKGSFGKLTRRALSNDSSSELRQELIIVVMPRFKGLGGASVMDSLGKPISNLEFILSGRSNSKAQTAASRLFGNAGFKY